MQMNRRILTSTLVLLLVIVLIGMPAMAQGLVGNKVNVKLSNCNSYETDGDSIANVPLEFKNNWFIDIVNEPDSGQPLLNPKIQLKTNAELASFRPNDPTIFTAQPDLGQYTWDFDGFQVAEPAALSMVAQPANNTVIAKPKFSAARSVEPQTLSGSSTTQTVTLKFRLEESLPPDVDFVYISMGSRIEAYQRYDLVKTHFASQIAVDGWNSNGPNGDTAAWATHPSNIEVGKTYLFQAELVSEKSVDLLGTPTFKPFVVIIYSQMGNQPVETANSLTLTTSDNAASATISADNTVDWYPQVENTRFDFAFRPVVSGLTPPPPPFHVVVDADVQIKPESLNVDSKGEFTAFIKLPSQYSADDILLDTVQCNNANAVKGVNEDGMLIAKFRRQDLGPLQPGQNVELKIIGELKDGSVFIGKDTVRVIDR